MTPPRGGAAAILLSAVFAALVTVPAAAEWRQAETEHFLIVFEPADQASADELASICEDVYAKVTGFFRSYPRKVPVVIRGRLDYANGVNAPFPERLELIVTAPSWPLMGSRSESWMRVLLTHEFTHYVHLGMERGIFHGLSKVFGSDVRWGPAVFLPGWLIEGPAIALETILTEGGRGRNAFFEAQYQAPVMEGRLFSLAQASYSSAFPPSGRHWLAGYLLVDHLLDEYGLDVVTRIMDDFLAFPFFGPWAAIERVTGKKARVIFDDMKAALEERYRPAAALAGGTRFSPDRVGDWQHPTPSARGLYASRSDLEGYPAIVRLAPDGTEETIAVIALSDPASFTVTADGATIYAASFFADWRPGDGEIVVSDLSVIDALSGSVRRITTGAHLWHPALSADGRRLVAVQGAGSYSRLVEVDPSTGGIEVLFSIADANVFNPAISPDGKRIALVVNQRGMQDVVVLDVTSGASAYVLGPDAFGEYYPSWHGDDRLLFSSDRSGRLALYEADLGTGAMTLVQEDPVAAHEGVVDAGTLVYGSYSAEGYCLKRAPFAPDTGTAVGAEPATAPVVAPVPAPIASEPYRDTARPYLWYPLVTLASGAESGWDIGIGAEVLAGSLLGTSTWSIDAAWHPLTGQTETSIAITRSVGIVRLEAGNAISYVFDPTAPLPHRLDVLTSVGASVPLVRTSAYDRGTSLTASAGVALFAVEAFSLAGWERLVTLDAGLSFSRARAGGPIDFLSPWIARLSTGGEVLLPVLEGDCGTRFTLTAQAGMPVLLPHLLLRAGLKAAWGTDSLDLPVEPFALPRGIFDHETRSEPGRLLGSLDLLAPIALLDQPLLFGLALLGISAGAHVEALADWDFEPAVFAVPWIYAGAEIVLQIGASGLDLPVGIGLSTRFDPTGARAFDISGDLRPYFFLSFDSFRDAWAGLGTGPRGSLVPLVSPRE